MDSGLLAGLLGSAVGVFGGIVGTVMAFRSARGPKERGFVVRTAFLAWLAIGVFIGCLILLPHPVRHVMWVPYGILLPLGIRYWNTEQAHIRRADAAARRARKKKKQQSQTPA